jgi:hypothetical protein
MRLITKGLSLALLSICIVGFSGCQEDNEAAIKEQEATAKNTIPGSRTAQAQTPEEYYQITPGVQGGAGTRIGPIPDQGTGYPSPRSTGATNSLMRLAVPRSAQGTGSSSAKK